MINNKIAVILQSVTSDMTEAMEMESILTLNSLRYMVFSSDNGIYIMKMNINEHGYTEFHDIMDEHEFDFVSKSYRALL